MLKKDEWKFQRGNEGTPRYSNKTAILKKANIGEYGISFQKSIWNVGKSFYIEEKTQALHTPNYAVYQFFKDANRLSGNHCLKAGGQ